MIVKFSIKDCAIDLGDSEIGKLTILSEQDKDTLLTMLAAVMSCNEDEISIYDEGYSQLDSEKYIMYFGNPLTQINPFGSFETDLRTYIAKKLCPYQIDEIEQKWAELQESLQKVLFTFNFPTTIRQEFGVKNILRDFQVGIDGYKCDSAYDKISLMIRLGRMLHPEKIMVFCDLTSYLKASELEQLEEFCRNVTAKVILIN